MATQQTIEFNQGDDYSLRLNGFNPEHKYKAYMQFFDEDGAFVGSQLTYDVVYTDSVNILFPASFTDTLTVPLGEDYQIYYLGGKQAEVIEDITYLYAWENDGSSLYTHDLSVAVDDALYDADNEATGDEVSSIEKIVTTSGTFTRDSENDTSDAYAWTLSGETIFTLNENPAVGEMTFNEDLVEGDEITAIASIMISTDEYVRNVNNDIKIINSTTLANEKTIISELANKRPVIVYKKRAEGPV